MDQNPTVPHGVCCCSGTAAGSLFSLQLSKFEGAKDTIGNRAGWTNFLPVIPVSFEG